jgi:tRNA threonylcarbamoyl adenosine modification protein YeaZ
MTDLMLGIDTATAVTTVALVGVDTAEVQVLDERSHRDARRHGEVLPQLINDVLGGASCSPAELTAVAVGVGPGAYTGLRVGIATAQALGLALGVPVVGVVTLDAIAYASGRRGPFAVVTDARRRELFVARYRDHRTPDGEATVGTPEVVASLVQGLAVLAPQDTPPLPGVDVVVCPDPVAAAVCKVAIDRRRTGSRTAPVAPLYLRHPDVTASSGAKSVL